MSELSLQDALKERVLVLDGAMGTMVQRYKLGRAITAQSVLKIIQ